MENKQKPHVCYPTMNSHLWVQLALSDRQSLCCDATLLAHWTDMRRKPIKHNPSVTVIILVAATGRLRHTQKGIPSLTHSHTASIMSVMYSRLPARLQDGAVSHVYLLQIKRKKNKVQLYSFSVFNEIRWVYRYCNADTNPSPTCTILLLIIGTLACKCRLINSCQQ